VGKSVENGYELWEMTIWLGNW